MKVEQTPIPEASRRLQAAGVTSSLTSAFAHVGRTLVSGEGKFRQTHRLVSVVDTDQQAETLFNALAAAKILTSKVAVQLNREWRDKFFSKIDAIHDADAWEEDFSPIQELSVLTFLRSIIAWRPKYMPSIGMSHRGNVLNSWRSGEQRLSIEYYPKDQINWVLVQPKEPVENRVYGTAGVSDLPNLISPYPQEAWFDFSKTNS